MKTCITSEWNPLKTLACVLIAVPFAIFLYLIFYTYSPVNSSDAAAIFVRMDLVERGLMSSFQAVAMKHIEHFHSLIFLMGLLDWKYSDGTLMIPRGLGALSMMGILAILFHSMRRSKIQDPISYSAVTALLLSAIGWGIWASSFQAVVSTFWFVYVAAIYLACKSSQYKYMDTCRFSACMAFAAISLFAHGSGVMAIVFVSAAFVMNRAYKKAAISFLLLTVLFIIGTKVNSHYMPEAPAMSGVTPELILRAVFSDTIRLFTTVLWFIGSTFSKDETITLWAGALGLAWSLAAIGFSIKRFGLERQNNFIILLIMSGLLSAALGAGMRFVINVYVNNGPLWVLQYVESRYYLASCVIWVGSLILTSRLVGNKILPASVVLCVASLYVSIFKGVPGAIVYAANSDMAESSFSSGYRSPELLKWYFPDVNGANQILDILEKYQKGPFSQSYPLAPVRHDLDISERTPVEVFHNGQIVQACRLSGPMKNHSSAVAIEDESGRVLAFGKYYKSNSNITPKTLDEDGYVEASPDLAALAKLDPSAAWTHYITFGRKEMLRYVPSKKPGWIAFAPNCNVRATQ